MKVSQDALSPEAQMTVSLTRLPTNEKTDSDGLKLFNHQNVKTSGQVDDNNKNSQFVTNHKFGLYNQDDNVENADKNHFYKK